MPKYRKSDNTKRGQSSGETRSLVYLSWKVKWYGHFGKQFESFLQNMQLPFFKKWGIFFAITTLFLYWFAKYSRMSNCYNADSINSLL